MEISTHNGVRIKTSSLKTDTGNARWTRPVASGAADYDTPGADCLGGIVGGAMDDCNVTLADELIALIQAQAAHQTNSKAISTEVTLIQST